MLQPFGQLHWRFSIAILIRWKFISPLFHVFMVFWWGIFKRYRSQKFSYSTIKFLLNLNYDGEIFAEMGLWCFVTAPVGNNCDGVTQISRSTLMYNSRKSSLHLFLFGFHLAHHGHLQMTLRFINDLVSSWHGNSLLITGPLWGKSAGHWQEILQTIRNYYSCYLLMP